MVEHEANYYWIVGRPNGYSLAVTSANIPSQGRLEKYYKELGLQEYFNSNKEKIGSDLIEVFSKDQMPLCFGVNDADFGDVLNLKIQSEEDALMVYFPA